MVIRLGSTFLGKAQTSAMVDMGQTTEYHAFQKPVLEAAADYQAGSDRALNFIVGM